MKKYTKLLTERIKSLEAEQLVAFNEMQNDSLLQLCYPCGFGKGYLIITDLLNQIIKNDEARIFAVCSHRLGLNDQHSYDIFNTLSPLFGKVAFAFIGSDGGLNMTQLCEDNNYNLFRSLNKHNLKNPHNLIAPNELTISTTNGQLLADFINRHHDKKIVIVSTYHSLARLTNIDVHTLYCDEAHELASDFDNANKDNSFRNNYNRVKAKRKYFFSATPKDCSDDPLNTFLMNNMEIFGRRLEMSHLEAVNKGYVVSTIIKFIKPTNYERGHNQNFGSKENIAQFILAAFLDNQNELNLTSVRPDMIAPKILVRCSSVEKDMWPLFRILQRISGNIKLFASASKDYNGAIVYNNIISQNGELLEYDANNKEFTTWAKSMDRKEYIQALQAIPDNEPAIVLHHDTISEGLNVPGFTAFIPLADKLITNSKLYQNLSRALRLNTIDKKNLKKGDIAVDGAGWIKPCAYMYIPYWSEISDSAADNIARSVFDLETKIGAKLATEIPYGDDHATGYNYNPESTNRKRVDNRVENLEGTIIATVYDRKKTQYVAENTSKNKLSPMERLEHLINLMDARNN